MSRAMSTPTPTRLSPNDPRTTEVLDLVKRSFAYMEDRIDPPSSMHRMSEQSIRDHCATGEVWTLGTPVIACIFLTPKPDCLYIGKLAVDDAARGKGYARQLTDLAEARARAHGLRLLELETRIELHENHATFARLGFETTGEAAHEGYIKPTFIIMQKPL